MRSLPVQAQALSELHYSHGIFGSIGVGHGKTLISLVAPLITRAQRPLLIVPANLIEKTRRDQRRLATDFNIPNYIRLVSYQMLGRVQHRDLIETWQPDLIIADEAHYLKNLKAGVTKRVARYLRGKPDTRVVLLSGTFTDKTLKDYWHLIRWALRDPNTPLPVVQSELDDWAGALDVEAQGTVLAGALVYFLGPEDPYTLEGIRAAYQRRLAGTPGVIVSKDDEVNCSITIARDKIKLPDIVSDQIAKMQSTWTDPNGNAFADVFALLRHMREMALGFFYLWVPAAPVEWLQRRKEWASWCRWILSNNRRNLDTELQATEAVREGLYPDATPALEAWEEIKGDYTYSTMPVWLSKAVAEHTAKHLLDHPGTIGWIEHTAFGAEVARLANLKFYGEGGFAPDGSYIEDAKPDTSLVASLASNREGKNLQHFHRAYYASSPSNGRHMDQSLGRIHRRGQTADNVHATILVTHEIHEDGITKALDQARYMQQSMGGRQKLLLADWV